MENTIGITMNNGLAYFLIVSQGKETEAVVPAHSLGTTLTPGAANDRKIIVTSFGQPIFTLTNGDCVCMQKINSKICLPDIFSVYTMIKRIIFP